MDEVRFDQLLNGDAPSLQDFAGFISVIEKLPGELLWTLATGDHKMHWMLQKALSSTLQQKVARENVDSAMNAIATRLMGKRE